MQADSKRNILLAGLFLAMFFSSLDQTVVGTAMPRIIGDLGGLSIMTWVTTSYMLTSTTTVPIAGKLSDLYGRRIVYIMGIMVFIAGSALCGISQTMNQLIVFRGIQGIGGGIMMPMAMTIVGDIFPAGNRGKWQGIIGAVFGLSSVIGPTIGGWIVDNSTWQWVFYVNLPIGLLAATTIYIGLQGEKRFKEKVVIDYFGAATLVAATVCLLLGLNLGGTDYSWLSWQITGLLGISAVFWITFVIAEKNSEEPILDLDLFNNRVFTIANIVGFLMGLGLFGSIMFLPLFLQGVIGVSATTSGNTMIPMMLALVLTSMLGGRIINRVPFRTIFAAGMATISISFYLLSTMVVTTSQIMAMSYIVILGFGMGLIMPTVTIAVQNAFPPEQRGVATAATQFFRSIGGTLGMTLLGVIFNIHSLKLMEQEFFPRVENVPALQAGPLGTMVNKAHADPHSLFNLLLSPEATSNIPDNLQQILLPPLRNTLSDSLHMVFFVAMLIAIIGFAFSLFIGNARIEEQPGKTALLEGSQTLLAEGIGIEGDIPPELVPDLLTTRESSAKAPYKPIVSGKKAKK